MNVSDSTIDRTVVSMERALAGLGRAGDVNHRISNQNLLLCLIHSREILLDVLEDSAGDRRARLIRSFGGDSGRVARVRAVAEETVLRTPGCASLGSESAARLAAAHQCIAACDSVDAVLQDKGACFDGVVDCRFFDIFTPRDATRRTDIPHDVRHSCSETEPEHIVSPISGADMAAGRPHAYQAICSDGGDHCDQISTREQSFSADSTSASLCLETTDELGSSSSRSSVEHACTANDGISGKSTNEDAPHVLQRCDSMPSPQLPTLLQRLKRTSAGQEKSRRMRRGTQFNSLKCMFSHGPGYSCPGCVDKTRQIVLPF